MIFKIFERFGIELEYAIVESQSLEIKSLADSLLIDSSGKTVNFLERDQLAWSNELVNHVIEIKNPIPSHELLGLDKLYQQEVSEINRRLKLLGCQLLSGSVHPWMNPNIETQLWNHEGSEIYSTYNKVFGCHGHGWSNLQSMHLNLSFSSDEEFWKLHSAIRVFLPLIPALTASSPVIDAQATGFRSNRLVHYLKNQKRIPSIIGLCIPEYVLSPQEYEEKILKPIYKDLTSLDPQGILQEEWVNSRGAIPKFERNLIEIRLADIQEAPRFDIALAWFIVKVLKTLVDEKWCEFSHVCSQKTSDLRIILDDCVRDAEMTNINDIHFLRCFGFSQPLLAKELLLSILEKISFESFEKEIYFTCQKVIESGTLSTRILNQLKMNSFDLNLVYNQLCDCLDKGDFFES